jgi:hypothetical protein
MWITAVAIIHILFILPKKIGQKIGQNRWFVDKYRVSTTKNYNLWITFDKKHTRVKKADNIPIKTGKN